MRKGILTVITGCMSSGKTEELLRLLRREQIADRQSIIFKHRMDTRAKGSYVESRAGNVSTAHVVQDGDIFELAQKLAQVETGKLSSIAIEEAQFFDYSLIDSINSLIESGFDIYVTGLNQDFRGEPFGIMPEIMALADKITLLTAVCKRCGREATMTQRLLDGKPAPLDGALILVGGDESYEARCRDCHNC